MISGLGGFSCAYAQIGDLNVAANNEGAGYTGIVDDLLERGNDDALRAFWFDCIDSDNAVLLDIFFNRLDYPDQNYFFYLNDDLGRTSLERAVAFGRVAVAEYLSRALYG